MNMNALHPSVLKAIDAAQARIPHSTLDIETILRDECPEFMGAAEFAYLVGIDCELFRLGQEIAREEEQAQQELYEMNYSPVCRYCGNGNAICSCL